MHVFGLGDAEAWVIEDLEVFEQMQQMMVRHRQLGKLARAWARQRSVTHDLT